MKAYMITNRTGASNMLRDYILRRNLQSVPERVFEEMLDVMFNGTDYIVDHDILQLISLTIPKLTEQLN